MLYLLTRHITGDGGYLIFVQIATALILTLAANTSFADFPRLSSFLARDGFMPRQFALPRRSAGLLDRDHRAGRHWRSCC